MSRAYITTFHNYSEPFHTDYYKVFYDYFVAQFNLWCDLVDTVYIIDTNWNFTEDDKKRLTDIKKEVVFYKSPIQGHHNKQYQEFLPQIKEDEMLFMDNDVFITKRFGISDWFFKAQNKEAVISWFGYQSSKYPQGAIKDPLWNKYPFLKERDVVFMESCHFLLTKKLLKRIGKDLDFMNYQPFKEGTYIKDFDYHTKKGDWCEFFGLLGYQILSGNNWAEMPTSEYGWGYYHVRACSYVYLLLSYKKLGLPQYGDFLKNFKKEDIIERLVWFYILDKNGKYHKELFEIVKDFEIELGEFKNKVYQLEQKI